jgi:hypothetical protein
MRLDPRIKSLSDILTCFDIEEAKQYIGQKGYFSDDIEHYRCLDSAKYGILTEIRDSHYQFKEDNNSWRFFIPESKLLEVKKKEFRPFTLREFLVKFPLLTTITVRKNGDNDCIVTSTFIGYRTRLICIDVCLGVEWVSLGTLADEYEYKNTLGDWLPFGVEE